MREKYMRLREQNPPIFTPKPPPTILPFDSLERYIFLQNKDNCFVCHKKTMGYVIIFYFIIFSTILFNFSLKIKGGIGSRRKKKRF